MTIITIMIMITIMMISTIMIIIITMIITIIIIILTGLAGGIRPRGVYQAGQRVGWLKDPRSLLGWREPRLARNTSDPRSLLGWLETRLARNTSKYLNTA